MRNLRILCYHDIAAGRETPMPGRRYPSLSEFTAQIAFLQSACRIVTLDEAVHYCRRGIPPKDFSVAITFDDGTAGVATAAEVLLERKIPFAVFLSTRFIGDRELPWFVYLNAVIDRASQVNGVLEMEGARFRMADPKEMAAFRRLAKNHLLRLPYRKQIEQVALIAWSGGLSLDDMRRGPRRFLTWQQAKELAAKGVVFGSHTHSHLDLTALADDELEAEFSASLQAISENLGRQHARLVAYPDGRLDRRVLSVARRYHESGFAATYRNASWQDMHRLPRRGVSGGGLTAVKKELSTWKEMASWAKNTIRGIFRRDI